MKGLVNGTGRRTLSRMGRLFVVAEISSRCSVARQNLLAVRPLKNAALILGICVLLAPAALAQDSNNNQQNDVWEMLFQIQGLSGMALR